MRVGTDPGGDRVQLVVWSPGPYVLLTLGEGSLVRVDT